MRKLGISIYPEKSTEKEIFDYIHKAKAAGFSRIFSCLLSANESKEEIKEKFLRINNFAHQQGFIVILDISPKVFDKLNISYQDLSYFKELNADGIRLDMGFSGSEEALMTFNPYDLKVEINMSMDTHTIDTIMDFKPNKFNLLGCHNFYPHRYSGLSLEHFLKCTDNFAKYGLTTAAFVSSQVKDSFGPWPVTDGLPTLEMHRNLPIHVQIKHLVALDKIDDIIISNCYPSQLELDNITNTRTDLVNFNVELADNLSEIERKIILEELHYNRGDISDNFIRSTQSRVKYKQEKFPVKNASDIKRGDIIIESDEYGHYKGELQVALNDMANSGKSSVVGKIVAEEVFILDYLAPWQKFCFQLSTK
ncbi:MAG: DUF871 domain-containing protein [Erysipelotrichaceae bacterium]